MQVENAYLESIKTQEVVETIEKKVQEVKEESSKDETMEIDEPSSDFKRAGFPPYSGEASSSKSVSNVPSKDLEKVVESVEEPTINTVIDLDKRALHF